jgi:DhnA family fructose-bisphosphate aldolase class Ia
MTPVQLHDDVAIGARIVAELGADAIKTFYTHDFKAVVAASPIPIFGLGAERLPTPRDALMLAQRQIEDGASGVVFGRNAIQVADPFKFQAALCEVVKRGKGADAVCRDYGLE